MRSIITFFIAAIIFSCNDITTETPAATAAKPAEEKSTFFPVTSYIKGQVHEIKEKGLTPLKYTTINNHTDSVLIKFSELDSLIKEFLHPAIDTANLVPFFNESRFLDQSINAFTFTYDPKPLMPDSVLLKHWDVYIDPENNKVKRVYIVKKINANKTLQLTWQSNQWCKTITIVTSPDGSEKVEKEEKISWDY